MVFTHLLLRLLKFCIRHFAKKNGDAYCEVESITLCGQESHSFGAFFFFVFIFLHSHPTPFFHSLFCHQRIPYSICTKLKKYGMCSPAFLLPSSPVARSNARKKNNYFFFSIERIFGNHKNCVITS